MLQLLNQIGVDFLVNMAASADVLAQAKVEVDLSAIPLGRNVRLISFVDSGSRPLTITTGHHKMARQARLHPPPDSR